MNEHSDLFARVPLRRLRPERIIAFAVFLEAFEDSAVTLDLPVMGIDSDSGRFQAGGILFPKSWRNVGGRSAFDFLC